MEARRNGKPSERAGRKARGLTAKAHGSAAAEISLPLTTEPVPLAETPVIDIEEPEVPLAELPEEPEEEPEELLDIFDEEVPLADVPQTGDATLLYTALTAISGMGLAWIGLKKKD